jgi:isopenicillin N synthase-like dioxygenase
MYKIITTPANRFLSPVNFVSDFGLYMQLINHGIACQSILDMIEAGRKFFELSFEERSKYMSKDMRAPVRYGTSFNQNKDRVFCWRDFLKLDCHPLSDVLPYWPSSPTELR